MPKISAGPSATMVVKLTEAPSMTMANSSTNFGAKADARSPQRPGLPRRAHRNAEQDRQHQRLEIRLAGEMDFDHLQQHRGHGDGDAHRNAREEGAQIGEGLHRGILRLLGGIAKATRALAAFPGRGAAR